MQRGEVLEGRFEIEERAGAGGMGQVFRSHDVHTGELVAVKMLLGAAGAHAARFALETRALARLSHPNIVRYLGHGLTASGEPYLAMEWLDGEDLQIRLRRGALSVKDSVEVARSVAEALGAAHEGDIVHRDLKPSNIFLVNGQVDRVKLLDFGIARWSNATGVTRTGIIVGTPGYMAPEQVQSRRPVDARADVFSLACVLYECLTGSAAFQAEHPMALFAKVMLDEPPPLRETRPDAPEALERLLSQMLKKDPDDRPPHGAAVAEALGALDVHESAGGAMALPVALTRRERRTTSVLLIGGGSEVTRTIEHVFDPILNDAETSMEDGLKRGAEAWGGALEQLRDGSVAVTIGGAGPATDQAAQAARCALALRRDAGGRRLALATGRGDTTGVRATGEAIDRAARMLLARAGSAAGSMDHGARAIAIDETTARLLDGRFDVRESDEGLTLHGEHELAEGTRTLLGRATPCVGRDLELRTLEQLFEECVDEPVASVALVTAPPGAGKSRLAQELLRAVRARGQPVSIWTGRGDALRAGSALGLLAQVVRGACGILEGEPLDIRRMKLVARVTASAPARDPQRVAELLGEMIGAPFPDEESVPLRAARKDALLMHEQIRAAFLDFLGAESEAHPVLLVLEDLHWGDRPTVQLVDHALRDLRDRPLFVFAMCRPEVHERFPKLWAGRRIQEIQLKQLGKKASERLVRHVLGDSAGRDTVDRLVRLADGNAFYLEELIRATAEGQSGDLPETVVAMVQSQLGALDDRSRRILRGASLFGEVFWTGAVASLLGADGRGGGARDGLTKLVERELITRQRESRFPGEDEFAFRHALLREGAYMMLTDEDRALGHRLAGGWLEEHGERDPLALAEHFEKGGDSERAGHHYLRAAEQTCWGGDSPSAIALARRGLACRITGEVRIRLLGLLCETHYHNIENLLDALPYAEELLRVAERGSAPWSQGTQIKLIGSVLTGER